MNSRLFSALSRILPALCLFFVGLPIYAASFDCAKASTKVEKLICSHSDLSKLDDELHDVYQRLLVQASDKTKIKTSQRHWLKRVRNPCTIEQCIASAYQERIHALQQRLAKAGAASKVRGKFVLAYDLPKVKRIYMPVLPKGGPGGFCQAFTDNLNQFRQLKFDTCSPRLSSKYPRFSRPRWQEIPLDMALAKKMMDIQHGWWGGWREATKAERAAGVVKMWRLRADFLGDGQFETMVRLDHAFTGYAKPSCSYFDSNQMLLNVSEAVTKAYTIGLPFNTSTLGNDLIYDSITKRYYILEWNRGGFAHVEREDAFVPNYLGGFRISHKNGVSDSVVVFLSLPQGPWPICWIDWVPAH